MNATLLPGLTPLTLDLVKQAAATGARAFEDDPTTFYLIPDPWKRLNLHYAFEYYCRLTVFNHEQGYATSPNCEGIAIWAHSGAREPFINVLRAGWPWLPLRCGWTYILRDTRLEHRYEKLRRELAPKPHMYLALLSVDPIFQGRGFAGRLMRPMLARLDTEKLPAYVETQNLKNVAMYGHYGFHLIREDIVPRAGFSMYIMVREPQSSST